MIIEKGKGHFWFLNHYWSLAHKDINDYWLKKIRVKSFEPISKYYARYHYVWVCKCGAIKITKVISLI